MILSNPLNPFNERKRIWRFGGRKTPKVVEDKKHRNELYLNKFLGDTGKNKCTAQKQEWSFLEWIPAVFSNFVFQLCEQFTLTKNYFQLIRNARQKNWAEQKKWKLTIGRKAGNKIITKSLDFAVCRPKSTLIGYIKCAGWSFIESNKC